MFQLSSLIPACSKFSLTFAEEVFKVHVPRRIPQASGCHVGYRSGRGGGCLFVQLKVGRPVAVEAARGISKRENQLSNLPLHLEILVRVQTREP